jgi:hypothetical protein
VFSPNAPYAFPFTPTGTSQPTSNGYGQGPDYVTPEQWAQALAQAQALVNAKAGGATPFERQVQQQKIDDLKRGYQNSLKIAQLQADTSRYGYDQTRQTALDQLKQADRQFALNHDLAVRNADISEAQLIAQQRSQPNRLFQTMDLEQALGSIRNGSSGRATTMPMTTGVAALNGLSTDYQGNPYLAGGGSGGGGGMTSPSSTQGTTGSGNDPRLTAANSIMKALPPSATAGLDPTAVAALNAVYHLYNAPLRPGSLESLSPTQQAGLQSGSERLQGVTGKSYDDLVQGYRRSLPGQQSVRAAA